MNALVIRKKSLKTWLHTDSILGDFIISKFYFNADNVSFQIVEQGQSKRVIYNIANITLYALPSGGTAETFTTITELSLRLEELNYPAFQQDGQITTIAGLIEQGTNVTITGDGTLENPYVINATGGSGGSGVQTVTGSAVDNTDPLNPVINNQDLSGYTLNGGYAGTAQDLADAIDAIPEGITGSGAVNRIAKFTPNGTTVGNSIIEDDGSIININKSYLGANPSISGKQNIFVNNGEYSFMAKDNSGAESAYSAGLKHTWRDEVGVEHVWFDGFLKSYIQFAWSYGLRLGVSGVQATHIRLRNDNGGGNSSAEIYMGNTLVFNIDNNGVISIPITPPTGTTTDKILVRNPTDGKIKQIDLPTTGGTLGANLFPYKVKTTIISGDPTAGHLIYQNATQITSTFINFSYLVEDGFDVKLFFQNFNIGDKLIIQDRDNSANNQVWEITSSLDYNSTFVKIDVTLVSSSGTGTTNFANNHEVFMVRQAVASGGGTPTTIDTLADLHTQDVFFHEDFLNNNESDFLRQSGITIINGRSGVDGGSNTTGCAYMFQSNLWIDGFTSQIKQSTPYLFGEGDVAFKTYLKIDQLATTMQNAFFFAKNFFSQLTWNTSRDITIFYDALGLWYGTASPNWQFTATSPSNVRTTVDSNIPVVAGQLVCLKLVVKTDMSVEYYINNILIYTRPASLQIWSSGAPSLTLVVRQEGGTPIRSVMVDYFNVTKKYNTPRP